MKESISIANLEQLLVYLLTFTFQGHVLIFYMIIFAEESIEERKIYLRISFQNKEASALIVF